ncbi:glycosyltransferase [Smaragdicoccus niigatensis]|uniref:glycosyltransferase n=1 Tax=Smaragdicoccus niigatensis TaxID=359359 RepID=UPI0003686EA0|nr:glycosyltransferase [Smaragdicoccus niigatensis]
MKVLFDGFWWHSGPPSGRTVLRETVRAWRRAYPDDALTLAVPRRDLSVADIPAGVAVIGTMMNLHPLVNGIELARLSREFDAVVAQNFAPWTGRSAVFIHDALFKSHPEWFTRSERLYLAPIPAMARRAAVVLTSSSAEAARIRHEIPKTGPVVATGLGLATELANTPSEEPADLGLKRGRFLLSVGRLNIRKNLERTIESSLESGVVTADCPLIIVGGEDGRGERSVDAPAGAVRFVGHRSNAQLRWLYENCALFLFLSLDEGFGLPPVEAHEFGAPVIVSDIPATRESLDGMDGVTFVNPLNGRQLSEQIASKITADRVTKTPTDPAAAWNECVRTIRDALHAARQR